MARKSNNKRYRRVLGSIFMGMAVITLLSLISYGHEKNYLGFVGYYLSSGVVRSLGLSAYFVSFALAATAMALFKDKWSRWLRRTILGLLCLVIAINALLALSGAPDFLFNSGGSGGGSLGLLLSELMTKEVGVLGGYLISIAVAIVSYSIVGRKPLYAIPLGLAKGLKYLFIRLAGLARFVVRDIQEASVLPATETEGRRHLEVENPATTPPVDEHLPHEPPLIIMDRNLRYGEPASPCPEPIQTSAVPKKRGGDFALPPFSLLDLPEKKGQKEREEDIMESTRLLEEKLGDFGISGKVRQVLPGPVVTMYEFEPASGIKVNRIVNLSDDLALGMRALSVRIVAPVPGKAVVGIEIPNKHRESVYLKEILVSSQFQSSKAKLALGLGKNIFGEPVVTDLAQIPHLLIAGATGSGKSVALNSMICNILFKSTPKEVKLIFIDPKRLELSIYEGVPHLICPVVIDPRKAATALHWAVEEMERRYQLLAEKGVRSIDGYNTHIAQENTRADSLPLPFSAGKGKFTDKLPYVVIVIDELADLMMVSSREVEDSLTRLAQMARAAGIHLLVATQRPSVDVLTGIIKVNFPARISFQVFSKFDSRTILDTSGAERLLGRGDMLFLRPGTSRLMRIHGPFVSEQEVKRLADFWRKQEAPEYDESVLHHAIADDEAIGEGYDEKYREAIALVARTGQASISMVQRRLRVGYNRSARMIEMMEREGLVGPADGSKPREVYVKESDLKPYEGQV